MQKLLCLLAACLLFGATSARSAEQWIEGKHYFVLEPRQMTLAPPGKIAVTEAFSYGCPACNEFYPIANQIKAKLPANAQMIYLPASFNASENWPTFQRAFYAAQALGVAERAHDAMFGAIWTTGELGIINQNTGRLKKTMPTIEDIAKFYSRVTGVKPEAFVSAANSFGVESSMKRADALMKSYKVPSTPTMIINGRYRTDGRSAGGYAQLTELVSWLVAKESATNK